MDKKSILGEIKKLINFNAEETKEAFKDAKVGDLIIRVEGEDFAVGLPVLIVTEDGAIPASPDLAGEHVLEDGRIIVLDEAGVITEVREAVGEVEELAEEVKEEEKMEEEDKIEKLTEEVKKEIETLIEEKEMKKYGDLEKRVEEMESIIKEMMEVNKETANFSSAVVKKLEDFVKDTPAEQSFKSIKTEYSAQNEKGNKIKTNLEVIKNLRKK
jgi:hypothetical protein